MEASIGYVGLDVHKKTVVFCVMDERGRTRAEGTVEATRPALSQWARSLKRPWVGALEATLFTGWIYDHLRPHARELKVAHPLMLKAIAAGKKKNDRVDACTLANLLRCDLLPESYMPGREIRELRRVLRYRNMVVAQSVRMKNKIAGLLMETGTPYCARRLHRKGYFHQLMDNLTEVPDSVVDLLRLSRASMEMFEMSQRRLLRGLRRHRELEQRVERLMTIPGVGEVTALTWALEVADPHRFGSVAQAVSFCGLCSAQKQSAGKDRRGPISKQRNKYLQRTLVEVAKLAPGYNPQLAAVHAREVDRGHKNRATLAVARKLVAYLLAVDKSGRPFVLTGTQD